MIIPFKFTSCFSIINLSIWIVLLIYSIDCWKIRFTKIKCSTIRCLQQVLGCNCSKYRIRNNSFFSDSWIIQQQYTKEKQTFPNKFSVKLFLLSPFTVEYRYTLWNKLEFYKSVLNHVTIVFLSFEKETVVFVLPAFKVSAYAVTLICKYVLNNNKVCYPSFINFLFCDFYMWHIGIRLVINRTFRHQSNTS